MRSDVNCVEDCVTSSLLYKDAYCTNTKTHWRNVEAEQLKYKNVCCLLINTDLCHLTTPQQDGRKGGETEGEV